MPTDPAPDCKAWEAAFGDLGLCLFVAQRLAISTRGESGKEHPEGKAIWPQLREVATQLGKKDDDLRKLFKTVGNLLDLPLTSAKGSGAPRSDTPYLNEFGRKKLREICEALSPLVTQATAAAGVTTVYCDHDPVLQPILNKLLKHGVNFERSAEGDFARLAEKVQIVLCWKGTDREPTGWRWRPVTNPSLRFVLAAGTRELRDRVSANALVKQLPEVLRVPKEGGAESTDRLVYPAVFAYLPDRLEDYGALPQAQPVGSVHMALAEVALGTAQYAIVPELYEAFDDLHQSNRLFLATLQELDGDHEPLRCQLTLLVRDAKYAEAKPVCAAVAAILKDRRPNLRLAGKADDRELPGYADADKYRGRVFYSYYLEAFDVATPRWWSEVLVLGRVTTGGDGGHAVTFASGLLMNCWGHGYRLTGGVAGYWPQVGGQPSGNHMHLVANQLPADEVELLLNDDSMAELRRAQASLKRPPGPDNAVDGRLSTFVAVLPYCEWPNKGNDFTLYGHWHGSNSHDHPTLNALVVSSKQIGVEAAGMYARKAHVRPMDGGKTS